jgi:hypothetical protein
MVKLINILKEIFLKETILSKHYRERKEQRGIIDDIEIPKESYEGYELEKVKTLMIPILQIKLNEQLNKLEKSDIESSKTNNIGYIIFNPIIRNKNKTYKIKIKNNYIDPKNDIDKQNEGDMYVVIIKDNSLITLLLYNLDNMADLKKKLIDHDRRTNKENNKEYIILKNREANFEIDIDELFGIRKEPIKPEKIDEKSLPYITRTDYRAGANFIHKTYGTGKIISTSSGNRGIPNSRGIVEWIEVDFGKPYILDKKIMKTRKFYNVYSTIYFNKQLKQTQNEIRKNS